MYTGTYNKTTGVEIWRSAAGDAGSWTQVNSDGFGDAHNQSAGLSVFKGYLYAATYNYYDSPNPGAELWRCQTCNGTDWEQVAIAKGLGDTENRALKLLIFENQLYAFTYNRATGMEIWRSEDGVSWTQVGIDGLGDSNNWGTYWWNSMTIFENKLYVGIWNNANAGEIWQKTPPTYIYLPLVLKNYMPPFYGPWEIEPNDDAKTQANGPIVSGQTYQGNLPPGDSKDYFYIDLQKTGTVEVWLTNIPAGQDYDLVLRDANLNRLGWGKNTGNADEHILSGSLQSGRYYIQVKLAELAGGGNTGGSPDAYQVKAVYR